MVCITKQYNKFIRVIVWAVTLGLIGFLCGFFGPIYFNPNANQGPMLGVFITGPVSIVVGIILGLMTIKADLKRPANLFSLIAALLIIAAVSLSMSMPEPRYVGFVIDAEVRGCKEPKDLIADKAVWWKNTMQEQGQWSKQSGWEANLNRLPEKDPGVVLEMWVYREKKFYEQRKPWSHSRIEATAWSNVNKQKAFFLHYSSSSCSKFNIVKRNIYFPKWEESSVTPPDVLPAFLGIYVLSPVPYEYRSLIRVD